MKKYFLSCACAALLTASPAMASGLDDAKTGLDLAQMGMPRLAITQFEKALQAKDLAPADRAKTLYNLGTLYLDSGYTSGAINLFKDVLALTPDDKKTLINLAEAHRTMGQHDKALSTLDRVIALDSSLADAHFARGLNLLSQNKAQEAEKAFTIAKKRKKDPRYILGLGRSLQQQKRHKEALASFNEVIRAKPALASAYIYRSAAHHGLGDKRKAGDDLNKALSLSPNDPLIQSYYNERRYGETMMSYKVKSDTKALAAPSADAPVYSHLDKGTTINLGACDKAGWCRVMFGSSLAGYVKKASLQKLAP